MSLVFVIPDSNELQMFPISRVFYCKHAKNRMQFSIAAPDV